MSTTTSLASGEKKTNLSSPMAANASSPLSSSSPLLMIPKVLPLTMRRKRPTQLNIPEIKPARTETSIFRDFAHQNDAVSLGGNGFGLVSRKGKKKFMEDTHRVVPCLLGNSKKGFFGVYDGHGGGKAAEFVAENLHKHVLEMMKNCKEKDEKVEAFKAAYLKTDRDFLEQGVVSGACCVTALVQDQEMIVSNLGDCRAVLCRAGVAEALTADHKAGRDDEKERIESEGGYVDLHRGAWRVNGTLAVSRSIGDANLKKWVVAEPETRILKLEQEMEFLVLASDGLWDVVTNQEAVDTVLRVLAQRKTPTESEAENLGGQGFVNVSPSSKLRRVSLLDSPPAQSPLCAMSPSSYNNSENEAPLPHCENGSPLSKLRRTTPVRRMKMDSESSWAKAACKELTNLAVNKGNMDDITVVIIDLDHYKC